MTPASNGFSIAVAGVILFGSAGSGAAGSIAQTAAPSLPERSASVASAASVMAQSNTAAGKTDRPTAFLSQAAPDYPAAELCAGVGGVVLVLVTVGAHGRPVDVVIEKSSRNRALDRAAMVAARNWTFHPRLHNGVAAVDVVRVPVQFDPGSPAQSRNCQNAQGPNATVGTGPSAMDIPDPGGKKGPE